MKKKFAIQQTGVSKYRMETFGRDCIQPLLTLPYLRWLGLPCEVEVWRIVLSSTFAVEVD